MTLADNEELKEIGEILFKLGRSYINKNESAGQEKVGETNIPTRTAPETI